jgi:hypothetical protein
MVSKSAGGTFAGAVGFTGGFTASDGCTITTDDNTAQLTLKSTDADDSTGPRLDLVRDSASPADADALGRVRFLFDNDAAEETEGIRITGIASDVSNGTEDAKFTIATMIDGTVRERVAMTAAEVVFNEDSIDTDFRIESNGDANMFVVDGGNNRIGFSTNSPTVPFEVKTENAGFQTILDNDNGSAKGLKVRIKANDSGDFPVFQAVSASTGSDVEVFTIMDDGTTTFTTGDSGTIIHRVGTNVAGIKTSSGDDFCVGTADFNQAIRIKNSTGRVGIGNTAPSHLLDATVDTDSASARFGTTDSSGANNGTVIINNGGTGDAMLRFDYEGYTDRARIGVTASGQQLEFYTGGNNERMSLDSGSLGVGIAAASASGRIHSQESNNRHAAFIHNTNASFSSATLQVSTSRNTTNSTYSHLMCAIHGVAVKMAVRDSGDLVNSNNSYGSLSDQRMKENIVDADSQWDDIKAVQVRKYNRIGATQKELGVIAQELEASNMGGLVDESEWFDVAANPDNEVRKSVKYSVLYMKAVKALQEAMTRIETLEAKVAALEAAE